MTLSRNKKSFKSTNNVRIDIIFNEQNDELPGRLFCLSRNSTAEIGHLQLFTSLPSLRVEVRLKVTSL